MTDLSWSAALLWCSVGSGLTLLAIGTAKRRKRRNRRVGLPAPECARVPAWEADKCALSRRQAS
ncbi:MAG: hypothetical protein JWO52_4096 [Gammaproteobacteria bacterium]|jgi:hypothetical protein|nr:hypothetical protein [Gammaproteobacteria bacterium]